MKPINIVVPFIFICMSGTVTAEYQEGNEGIKASPQINRTNANRRSVNDEKHSLEYLDDLESRSDKKSGSQEGSEDLRSQVSSKSESGKLASKSSCTNIWMRSYNKYKYSSYIPAVSVKTRLWVNTNTYLGGPSNPNQCGKPKYHSDKLRHSGEAISNAACSGCGSFIMAKINNYQANNASYINSYRKQWSYGTAVHKPNCAYSKHYSTNNGRTLSKTLKTGRC